MKKNQIIAWAITMLFSTIMFAQGASDPAARDAQIASIYKLNTDVNNEIGEKKLFVHRLSLNSVQVNAGESGFRATDSNPRHFWPSLEHYRDNVTCYFSLEGGQAILKKIVVTSEVADRKPYIDFLYDRAGNMVLAFASEDYMRPTSNRERMYFFNNRMLSIAVNDDTYTDDQFDTKHVQRGIDIMQLGQVYKQMFQGVAAIHLLNR